MGEKNSGPSGNRTRVLGSEAQEDVLYPMDPSFWFTSQVIKCFYQKHYWMILSGTEIRRRLAHDSLPGNLVIRPYSDECQQPASYDLRAGEDMLLNRRGCMLLPTLEWVELPEDLAGTLRCRSSFGRRGILLGGGFIDPGFRGQLTLCLTNSGSTDVEVRRNDRIVQMVLHEVRGGDRLYGGRYQDSKGIVEAR